MTETEIPSEVMRSPDTVAEEEKKIETETSDSEESLNDDSISESELAAGTATKP